MLWTIEYTEAALTQLHKLDKQTARRIVDYMDERVAPLNDPRSIGRVLGGLCATASSATCSQGRGVSWS